MASVDAPAGARPDAHAVEDAHGLAVPTERQADGRALLRTDLRRRPVPRADDAPTRGGRQGLPADELVEPRRPPSGRAPTTRSASPSASRLAYQRGYDAKKRKKRKTEPRAPHTRSGWTDAEVAQLATYLVTPAAFDARTNRWNWKGVEAAVPTKTGDQCRNKLHRQSSDGEHLRALVKAAHPTA